MFLNSESLTRLNLDLKDTRWTDKARYSSVEMSDIKQIFFYKDIFLALLFVLPKLSRSLIVLMSLKLLTLF
jgi:hypothetical protein